MTYLLAIDGGGTSCRAAIASLDGVVLGRATAGPANIATDAQGACKNIIEAARGALENAGLHHVSPNSLFAFLGLAGANVISSEGLTTMLPFAQVKIVSDITIALESALGDNDGILAILGTGSNYLGRQNKKVKKAGGWGFTISDLGSGARLGQALLQDTLLAHDGILPHSGLTHEILSGFDNTPEKLAIFAKTASPAEFARFAPPVFEHAGNNDPTAIALVKQAAMYVDAALAAVAWDNCDRLVLVGGLAHFYAPIIAPRFQEILAEPYADALAGAMQLAVKTFSHQQ